MNKRKDKKEKIKKKTNPKQSKRDINQFLSKYGYLPYLIIIIFGIATYYQTINFNIVECDDHEIIIKDFARINNISNWDKEFGKSYMHNSYYRPLVNISFMLNAQMSGENPVSYHITNLVFHLIVASLVFYFFTLLGYNRFISLLAGIIYSVHPLFTNAVDWIVGRNDLLFSIFILLSFIFLIKFKLKENKLNLLFHSLFFLFALFTKETSLVAPILFVAYLIIIKKDKIFNKQLWIYLICWIIPIAIWFIFRANADLSAPVYNSGFDIFLFNLRMIPEFVAKFFLPVKLSVLPTYNMFNTVSGIVIIALLIIAYIRSKSERNEYFLFGVLWFLVLILPGMFITLKNSHIWNEYLECRAYLASLGLIIVLAELIPKVWLKAKLKKFVIAVVILFLILSSLTHIESKNYINPLKFYKSVIANDDNRASFHYILGQLYHNNMYKSTKNTKYLDSAEEQINDAIKLRPNHSLYYQSLGAVYSNHKKYELAIRSLKKAISHDSNVNDSYNGLAMCYYYLGMEKNAIGVWRKAISKWNEDQDIMYNLADVYFKIGNIDSAFYFSNIALKYDNSEKNKYEFYYMFNKWGGYYVQSKQNDKAVEIFQRALNVSPQRSTAYENLMNFYLIIEHKLDSASYYAKKIIEHGGKISDDKKKVFEKFMNKAK